MFSCKIIIILVFRVVKLPHLYFLSMKDEINYFLQNSCDCVSMLIPTEENTIWQMSTVALWEVFDKQTIQTITETYLQRGGVGWGWFENISLQFTLDCWHEPKPSHFSLSSHKDYAVKSPKITLTKKVYSSVAYLVIYLLFTH